MALPILNRERHFAFYEYEKSYLILWPFRSKRLPFFSMKSFWSSKRRRGCVFCSWRSTGITRIAFEPCELEEAPIAKELEDIPEIEEDVFAVATEELLTFEEELCKTLEEDGAVAELEATEELLFCSEELEAGTSFFATPETAKSGA